MPLPIVGFLCLVPTLQSSPAAAPPVPVEVHIGGTAHQALVDAGFAPDQRDLARDLAAALSRSLARDPVAPLEAGASPRPVPCLRITLVPPEPAGFASAGEVLAKGLLHRASGGIGPLTREQALVNLGLDREAVKRHLKAQKTAEIFLWGPATRTAQREHLARLGYTPLVLEGRCQMLDAQGTHVMADHVFLGWDLIRAMQPLPATATPAQRLQAMADALAQKLQKHLR